MCVSVCLCNTVSPTRRISKADAIAKVAPFLSKFEEFWECHQCGQVVWKGLKYDRCTTFFASIYRKLSGGTGGEIASDEDCPDLDGHDPSLDSAPGAGGATAAAAAAAADNHETGVQDEP